MKTEMYAVRKHAQTYIFPSGGYQTLPTEFNFHNHAQTDSGERARDSLGKLTVLTHFF